MSDHIIELYARDPEHLDLATRTLVEEAIAESEALRSLVAFWRSFYHEFESMVDHASPHVDAFVDSLYASPGIAELRAPHVSEDSHPASDSVVSVMAAASADTPSKQFDTLCTLISKEKGVVLRLVYDRQRQRCRVYVMGDNSKLQAHALVVFSDWPAMAVTDVHGKADLPADVTARPDVGNLQRALIRPELLNHLLTHSALRTNQPSIVTLSEDVRISIEFDDDAVSIRIDAVDESAVRPRYVSVEDAHMSALSGPGEPSRDRPPGVDAPVIAPFQNNLATLRPGGVFDEMIFRFFE